MPLDDVVLEFIRRNGPCTPVEVAQRVGANSLIVAAVLIDAVSQNKIKKSKRNVGSMRFYYYPDQLSNLQKKVTTLLTPPDKEMIQKLMTSQIIGDYEVQPQEISILNNLEDLINSFAVDHNGQTFKCWSTPNVAVDKAKELAIKKIGSLVDLKKEEETPLAKVEEVKQEVEKKVEKPKEKPKAKKQPKQEVLVEMKGKFRNSVLGWLEKQDVDVIKEKTLEEEKEYELEVKVPTPFGKQSYLVRVVDVGKRPTSQSYISTVGTDAASRRIPAIIISSTGFAKSAKKYWEKELQDLITLVSKEDLE